MNWLAHLLLSDPVPEFQVGNVLTDILPISELRALPNAFQAGVQRHRQIDKYTDSHAIVRHSIARLDSGFRRYGGIIMDVFYDHLLTVGWTSYSSTDLNVFLDDFYAAIEHSRPSISGDAYTALTRIRTGALLASYGDMNGVRTALDRIGKRLRRPFDLGAATDELSREYDALSEDFMEFFPQIRAHFLHSQ